MKYEQLPNARAASDRSNEIATRFGHGKPGQTIQYYSGWDIDPDNGSALLSIPDNTPLHKTSDPSSPDPENPVVLSDEADEVKDRSQLDQNFKDLLTLRNLGSERDISAENMLSLGIRIGDEKIKIMRDAFIEDDTLREELLGKLTNGDRKTLEVRLGFRAAIKSLKFI